jgi:UDP-N-acetylglucosamine 1-carboxyvinyltransferase
LDKFVIYGEKPLMGEIEISGSKNAALPIMAATLLTPGKFKIDNVPQLRDVRTMAHLLRVIGAKIEIKNHTVFIDTTQADFPEAPYELVKTMRASIYVLGPLLARFGKARVSLPGGCAWGPRPVDLHIKGMKKLGTKIKLDRGYINASSTKLTGNKIYFDVSSVGATGNVMMAAVLSKGETIIENAASEPEIADLGHFLQKMGARIEGLGTKFLRIVGVPKLHPSDYTIIPDRIETATFITAGLITKGNITIKKCQPNHIKEVLDKFIDTGVELKIHKDKIEVKDNGDIKPVNVTTAVYPGFPTDMQAQWIALMSLANGSSVVTDTIFTDRFTHVPNEHRFKSFRLPGYCRTGSKRTQ